MTGTTAAAGFRERVGDALAQGWRVAGLHASDHQTVRVLLTSTNGKARIETIPADRGGAVPTITDLAPAVIWDEREAHDLYGIGFTGHQPLRPLADHAAPAEHWMTPVAGNDTYQVAVGPVHAGVIESGHFRFHVVGDRILHLDARLFYKHRGLERAAEGLTPDDAAAVIGRSCAACTAANALAFASAVEETSGLQPSPQIKRARTILVELERTWNHLNDIAAVCAGTGLAAGQAYFLALTERIRRLNVRVAGHRFLSGAIKVGRSTLFLDAETVKSCAAELATTMTAAESGWRELLFNASFQNRLSGVGAIDAPTATSLGVVGPAARAAGVATDARIGAERLLCYPGFAPVGTNAATGDVRARLEQRVLELRQSAGLLQALLDAGPIEAGVAEQRTLGRPIGIGLVESPRGMTSCVVEASSGRIGRVRLRTGSYANWPAVAAAAAGALLPDFPLINKSFELCYACADR